jgi:hypothetical protein
MSSLSQISDRRISREIALTRDDGSLQQIQLLEFVSADDLVFQAVKAIIAEKVADIPYQSVMDRTVVSNLIQARVPVVRK